MRFYPFLELKYYLIIGTIFVIIISKFCLLTIKKKML